MRQIQWVSIRIIMTAVQEVHKVTSCLYFPLVSTNYLHDFSVDPNYWDRQTGPSKPSRKHAYKILTPLNPTFI